MTMKAPSPLVKYGVSCGGQPAPRILGQVLREVAAGVTVGNWGRLALVKSKGDDSTIGIGLQELIKPRLRELGCSEG